MKHELKEDYREKFVESYTLYSDSIFRYCFYKTSSREKALDLTQDVFLKAWEYISLGNKVRNIKSLLFTMATHLVIDEYRKKKTTSLESLLEKGFDLGHDEEIKHGIDHDIKDVLRVLQNLDEKYRDIIIMRYVEDLSISEIANITGESESNVSVRIHRALEKIRRTIDKK